AAADARLTGAREALQAAKARELQTRNAIEPQPPQRAGLRTAEGKHLPPEAIEAHMLAHGVPADANGKPLVGFISHQQDIAGAGSFYKSILRRPAQHSFTRTGEAYRK